MDAATVTTTVHEDNSTYRFTPLQSGFDILVGEMPAALVTFSRAMGMDGSQEILFFTESGMLGPDNTSGVYLNPVAIGDMIDRGYAGYQEVPLIASKPVDGGEVLVGVSQPTFSSEIAD